VDAFTGQGLKVSGGTGTEKRDWGRFFLLIATAMAYREQRPPAHNTPSGKELTEELRALARQLRVVSTLAGWSYAMRYLREEKPEPGQDLFLIVLDTEKHIFNWTPFNKSQMKIAQEEYLKKEQEIQSVPGSQAVLVSVDSIDALRAAYPNYYADTGQFVEALDEALGLEGAGRWDVGI
jgi:hypothetical protein